MRRVTRWRVALAAALAGGVVCVVAVQNTLLAAPAPARAATGLSWVPSSLLGLTVQRENVASTLSQDKRALWIDEMHLYSLRNGRELEATLEIARFKPSAPWRSPDFDLSLAAQIGTTAPVVARLGGVRAYVTSTRGLGLVAWFERGYMVILGIRPSYSTPKDLIRRALVLTP